MIEIFHRKLIGIIFCLLIVISNNEVNAQVKDLKFRYLTSKEGLNNNNIQCIIQNSKGYLWFGTEGGLHRYNGYDFIVYTTDRTDPSSISGNIIKCLAEDKDQNLWIGTTKGIDMYNPQNNSFVHIPVCWDESKENHLNYNIFVRDIYIDDEGSVFVGAEDIGLLTYETSKKYLKSYSKKYLSSQAVRSITKDKQNNLWLATGSDSIVSINLKSHESQVIKHKCKRLLDDFIQNLKFDSHDNLWMNSQQGLNRYNFITKKNKNYKFYDTEQKLKIGLTWNIFEDEVHNLWFTDDNNGILYYNQKNDKFIQYNSDIDDKGLNSNKITYIYGDKQKNLWVGTYNAGINIASDGNLYPFKIYQHSKINKNSLNYHAVLSVLEDKTGNLFIGTDGGGLNCYDRANDKFSFYKHDPSNPNSIGSDAIMCIFEDSKGIKWTGSFLGGLNKFDQKKGTFINFKNNPGNNNSLSHDDVRGISEDEEGNLLIVTNGGGLNIFNPIKNLWQSFKEDVQNPDAICCSWCTTIYKDSEGIYWIGTYRGLSRFDVKTKSFTNFQYHENSPNSLSDNFVYSILEDSKHHMWFGTSSGLNLLDKPTKTFTCYTKHDGLPDETINGIHEDKKGNIWLATSNGLCKFNYLKLTAKNYDTDNGLPSNQFINCSSFKSKNGEFFFGTVNGLISFYPDSIKSNQFIPPVYISDFQLSYKSVKINTKGSPLVRDISETKELILSHSQSIITFKYEALNFINSQKNQYAYMMENFDKTWNYVGNKREATYTNLDPGEYVFMVKASNNDGIWNENGTKIKIIIYPPWWSTWWFRTIIVLLVIINVVSFYFYRISNFKHQKLILEQNVNRRTKELKEANSQLKEQQNKILDQNIEIISQRDAIASQNEELFRYGTQLEKLVKERTLDLEKAKNKAEDANKLKTSFLDNLSHEIRTPLNAILGFTELVISPESNQNNIEQYLQIIRKNSNNLLNLINDIIDISKIESGQIIITNRVFSAFKLLNDLFIEIKNNLEIVDYSRNVEIKLNIPENLKAIQINSDLFRLKQILINLTKNAIKFTHKGYIEIGYKLEDKGKQIDFYVKDTGIGIDEKYHEIIFERFRKIEDDNSVLYRGTGLGLAISKKLAELLGGNMKVESELGKGSTFKVNMPLINNDLLIEKVKDMNELITNKDLSGKTILVAEDEISNYLLIETILKKSKAIVLKAETGVEAIAICNKEAKIDLIIMDIKMPEMDGKEATIRIKKQFPSIPIIALTAFAFSEDVENILKAGFDGYITKPIMVSQLKDLIYKHIA